MLINFTPNPLCQYKNKYDLILRDIANEELDARVAYRDLIKNDLFFVVMFVVKPFLPGQEHTTNHPFVVKACRMVEDGPVDYTEDIWAREHFKSSIITIGETIQFIVRNPEAATAIFSHNRPAAKKFLFGLKCIFENEPILPFAFPEIFYENPQKESPLWSLDEGLVLKRASNRREPTVAAFGLVEGMPVGGHYERRIYDDIVTQDIKDSPDQIAKVKDRFDVSHNLGTNGGTHRVVGTFYSHTDPLVYIKDKKHPITQKPMYLARILPGSDNGEASGTPVLLSQERWDLLKGDSSFSTQQLCDPTPRASRKLLRERLKYTNPSDLPSYLTCFLVVDPAGDNDTQKGDAWAIELWGIEPVHKQSLGVCRRFLLDAIIEPMRDSEAIDAITRMYLNSRWQIMKVGIEKVGLSSVEVHVANALRAHGRHISEAAGSLQILRPAGRKKIDRILQGWEWPLNNGMIHILTSVPDVYVQRLLQEMDLLGAWHDDGLDAGAYIDDMTKDIQFSYLSEGTDWEKSLNHAEVMV